MRCPRSTLGRAPLPGAAPPGAVHHRLPRALAELPTGRVLRPPAGVARARAPFTTSNAGIASLNGSVVTGVAQGIATVTATVGTLSRGAQITVTNATVTSIAVLPATTTI